MKRSLANHILVSSFIIATVALALVAGFTHVREERELLNAADVTAQAKAARAAGRVDDMTRASLAAVRSAASSIDDATLVGPAIRTRLTAIHAANPVLRSLQLVDTVGSVIAA
jgi:hypothetical protein